MKKRLIIVGAHGSGDIAMTVFEDINSVNNEWEICGFINDMFPPGAIWGKYKILGGTDSICDFVNKGYYIHYTYHFNAKKKNQRVADFKNLNIPLESNATGIHPLAYLNPSSKIGCGSLLLPHAATSAESEIGNFAHVYTNGFIGHNSVAGNFSTIAAHSVLGARIDIQEGAHVGLNACVREDIIVGEYGIIGMGAVVVKNVNPFSVVAGNPAKEIKKLNE
jgi:acetyltransferase EpsM